MNTWQKFVTTVGLVSVASLLNPVGAFAMGSEKAAQNSNLSGNQGQMLIAQAGQTCEAKSTDAGEGKFIGVRDQPNQQGKKIGSFPNGTKLAVESVSPDGSWALVSGPNLKGWVWKAYLINCK